RPLPRSILFDNADAGPKKGRPLSHRVEELRKTPFTPSEIHLLELEKERRQKASPVDDAPRFKREGAGPPPRFRGEMLLGQVDVDADAYDEMAHAFEFGVHLDQDP